jgi:hypothetical protein
VTAYDDLMRAKEVFSRVGYEPDPPMPAEMQLLLSEFSGMTNLLSEVRDVVNRWADRDDVTDQTAALLADLLLTMHNGGWSS